MGIPLSGKRATVTIEPLYHVFDDIPFPISSEHFTVRELPRAGNGRTGLDGVLNFGMGLSDGVPGSLTDECYRNMRCPSYLKLVVAPTANASDGRRLRMRSVLARVRFDVEGVRATVGSDPLTAGTSASSDTGTSTGTGADAAGASGVQEDDAYGPVINISTTFHTGGVVSNPHCIDATMNPNCSQLLAGDSLPGKGGGLCVCVVR
jgi:hypothetical protein